MQGKHGIEAFNNAEITAAAIFFSHFGVGLFLVVWFCLRFNRHDCVCNSHDWEFNGHDCPSQSHRKKQIPHDVNSDELHLTY